MKVRHPGAINGLQNILLAARLALETIQERGPACYFASLVITSFNFAGVYFPHIL
jgi:hypothetical protein